MKGAQLLAKQSQDTDYTNDVQLWIIFMKVTKEASDKVITDLK